MFHFDFATIYSKEGEVIDGFVGIKRSDTNKILHICNGEHYFLSPEDIYKICGGEEGELIVLDNGLITIGITKPTKKEGSGYATDNYIAIVSDLVSGYITVYGITRFCQSKVDISFVIDKIKITHKTNVDELILLIKGYSAVSGNHPYKWSLSFRYIKANSLKTDIIVKSVEDVVLDCVKSDFLADVMQSINDETEIYGRNIMSVMVGTLIPFVQYKIDPSIGWYKGIYRKAMVNVLTTISEMNKNEIPVFL